MTGDTFIGYMRQNNSDNDKSKNDNDDSKNDNKNQNNENKYDNEDNGDNLNYIVNMIMAIIRSIL